MRSTAPAKKENTAAAFHTDQTVRLAMASMFAALVLLATSFLKIQTPAFGYIHVGEAFVLLSGLFMGPVYGGLAAGIGSALADLLGGYALWAPGTFLIKFLTAAVAGILGRALVQRLKKGAGISSLAVVLAGLTGEAVMITGYFFYNILIVAFTAGSFTKAGFASALAISVADIPFNAIQGLAGILLAAALTPVFGKVLDWQRY